jgi:putative ABC transport system substrate-binding protein
VFPTEAALEAKAATSATGIPVIFINALIEGVGLINSIREPGGNITGVRWGGTDLAIKRFEILYEMVPTIKRMIIIYMRGYPIVKNQLDALQPIANKNGITLLEIPANDPGEVASELAKLKINSSTDAILAIAEPLFGIAWEVIGGFADKNKIPVGAGIIGRSTDSTFFIFFISMAFTPFIYIISYHRIIFQVKKGIDAIIRHAGVAHH